MSFPPPDDRSRASGALKDAVCLGLLLLITVAGHWPSLRRIHQGRLINDWTVYAKHHALLRISVVEHGQFPLWSHCFGGGFPVFAHPEWVGLNPLSWPVVFVGDVAAIKLKALLIQLIGVAGFVYLIRRALRLPSSTKTGIRAGHPRASP